MANPRKPSALKIIQGTYRPERAPKSEPKPKVGLGKPPPVFNHRQRVLWRSIASDCPVGLLTRADRRTFARYVVGVDKWLMAVKEWNASGNALLVDLENGGKTEHPLLKVIRRDMDPLRALENEMGFTPAARTRIDLAAYASEPVEESKLKKYAS